jgi:hypothetical protein
MLSDQHAEVVAELAEVIEFVRAPATTGQTFEFSVVM